MRWPTAIMAVVIFVAGCQGSNPNRLVDPFLGRQRIPAPRTGWFNQADPYYSETRQAAAPSPDSQYSPPGGTFRFQGSRVGAEKSAPAWNPKSADQTLAAHQPGDTISIPESARRPAPLPALAQASRPSEGAPGPDQRSTRPQRVVTGNPAIRQASDEASLEVSTPSGLTGRSPVVRTIQPLTRRPAPSSRTHTPMTKRMPTRAPRRPDSGGRLIDITELPEYRAGASRSPTPAGRSPKAAAVRLVSGTESGGQEAVKRAVATESSDEGFAPASHYGYDPEYKWLRGRLEYSQIDRRWKLRYIPIDGQTDRFGGSVILEKTDLLSGYQRGDYVEVQGQVGRSNADKGGFAPEYHVTRIRLLDR
ncbi:MAG TPA: hypothetical protein EYP56_01550 [Planctomycetaceae bacterium]|nr:hypothetical protein [Planctomycetaceae bacterium]HIQ21802.1 hypothetical protein [Planctomycetota bacterium]